MDVTPLADDTEGISPPDIVCLEVAELKNSDGRSFELQTTSLASFIRGVIPTNIEGRIKNPAPQAQIYTIHANRAYDSKSKHRLAEEEMSTRTIIACRHSQ